MLLYRLVRALVRACLVVFFRQIEVVGDEHVPEEGRGAVIFAGNHPNSLIDPALIVAFCGRVVHFAAKDVLFTSPFLRPVLRALGAVPVSRRKDHPDGPLDNEGTFERLFEILGRGRGVGIFPEGISHDDSQLAPLKTGAARVAFGVATRHPDCPVRVVPTGLNYGRPKHFRSSVLVRFGRAIEIDAVWLQRYREDPRGAVRALTDRIELSMRALTINAEDWETIRVLDAARRLYQPPDSSLEARVELGQRFAEAYPAVRDLPDVREVVADLSAYQGRLAMLGLGDRDLRRDMGTWAIFGRFYVHVLRVLLWLPLAVPGFAIHAPLAIAVRWLGWNVSPRKDVVATSKLVAGFGALLLTWTAIVALVGLSLGGWAALIAALLLPQSAWATLRVIERYVRARSLMLSVVRFARFRAEVRALRKEREQLTAAVIGVVQRHLPGHVEPMFLEENLARIGPPGGDVR